MIIIFQFPVFKSHNLAVKLAYLAVIWQSAAWCGIYGSPPDCSVDSCHTALTPPQTGSLETYLLNAPRSSKNIVLKKHNFFNS